MAILNNFTTQLLYAFFGGLLPALIWLFFWLREDLHPEPKRLLLKAFAAGAIAIPFALLAEMLLSCAITYAFIPSMKPEGVFLPVQFDLCSSATPLFRNYLLLAEPLLLISFAAAEEMIKYISARHFVLKGKNFDEPVDAMIYLITVALGFAAFENMFFLVSAFSNTLLEGFVVTNLRFLGATLLHAVSSGMLGYAIALSFYQQAGKKRYLWGGLFCATILHTIFNVLVINTKSGPAGLGQALSFLILTSTFLIFSFDRVKKIKQAARFPQQTPFFVESSHI